MPMRQPPCESLPVPGVTMPGQFGPMSHHVAHGDAFGDGDDEVEARVHALEDGVGGEGRRDEDGAGGRAGLLHGLSDGVEDGHLVAAVLEELAALAGRDTGNELRAVVERKLGVAATEFTGDALDEEFGLGSDENGHGKSVISVQ
jgi:hypothetical protein